MNQNDKIIKIIFEKFGDDHIDKLGLVKAIIDEYFYNETRNYFILLQIAYSFYLIPFFA